MSAIMRLSASMDSVQTKRWLRQVVSTYRSAVGAGGTEQALSR